MGYNLNVINKKDKTMPSVIRIPICAYYFEDKNGNIFNHSTLVTSDVTNTSVIANSIGINNKYNIRDFYHQTYDKYYNRSELVTNLEIIETITIPDDTKNGQWLLFLNIDNYYPTSKEADIQNYGMRIQFAQYIKKLDRNKFEVHIIIEDIIQVALITRILIRKIYLGVKI